MDNHISLAGVYPPLPTPFTENGELDLESLQYNLNELNQYALSGYVLMGSNGEFVNMNAAERLAVVQAGREVIPKDKLLIVGTAVDSTYHTIRLTEQAAQAGADVALVLTPNYYKGAMNSSALIKHFHAVAGASPIPIMIYNMPANAVIDMAADAIIEAAQHPNIIGMKESSPNLGKAALVIKEAPEDFQFLTGSANLIFPALAIGAVGGIMALANIATLQLLRLISAFENGRFDTAQDLQHQLIPANNAITTQFGIGGLKVAQAMVGLKGGVVRAPLQMPSAEQQAQLQAILKAAKILG